ncbi:MAG TPA: class I SAM-dependent methyltransferase [Fimbriimonas sp.]
MLPSTERFTTRVANYVSYRPSYPREVVALLQAECGLRSGSPVADVGSGTGIFSRLLLDVGAEVLAVEPNDAMRAAAESWLGDEPGFRSIKGTAEATGLTEASVGLVTSAQAFHWFDRERARSEFRRILAPGGSVALVWNERLSDSPFLQAYDETLKTYSDEYEQVRSRDVGESEVAAFFGPVGCRTAFFSNLQSLDLPAFLGRVMSSSYSPQQGHPSHEPFVEALRQLFAEHREADRVVFRYETRVYYGPLGSA